MKKSIIKRLQQTLTDKQRVMTNKADLNSYGFDGSFGHYEPEIVLQPVTTEETAAIVRIAKKYTVPIYPRGCGTCLSGGPLPVKGGIVLDLSRMNQKLDIDKENLIATVSPGVLTADIKKAAQEYGYFYPPDPSSAHVSSIGGNVAENSGGPRGLKYGVTNHYVLGLEVVTPQGEIVKTGGRTIKNVTGYDMTSLYVGSEGTLGIVTEITLRLIPAPQDRVSLLAAFDDIEDAGRTISAVLSAGIMPSAMEIMDDACIQAVERYRAFGYPTDVAAVLLLELDGHPRAIQEELEKAEHICRGCQANWLKTAVKAEKQAELWEARKLISPAIAQIKPTKISEDATVPREQIPAMFRELHRIRVKYDVNLVVFGHAGDGNLHPNILADERDKEEMKRVEKAVSEIFKVTVELNGTLSGEHGIGTMKAPFMKREVGEEGLGLMKSVKLALDPDNIMNPGKIFAESDSEMLVLK